MMFLCKVALAQVLAMFFFLGLGDRLSSTETVLKVAVGTVLTIFVTDKVKGLGRLLYPLMWCFFPILINSLTSLHLLVWGTGNLSANLVLAAWALAYAAVGLAFRDWRAARECSWWHLLFHGFAFLCLANWLRNQGYGTPVRAVLAILLGVLSYLLAVALTRHRQTQVRPKTPAAKLAAPPGPGHCSPRKGSVLQSSYGTAYKIQATQGTLHLQLWDRDREDPLRPQAFALSRAQAEELLQRCRAQQSYAFAREHDKFVINALELESEDYYGPHFSLEVDEAFFARWSEVVTQIPLDLPALERLARLKADFEAGRIERFDPASEVALSDLKEDSGLKDTVRTFLKSSSSSAVLWAVSFLYPRMEKKLELVAGLLPVLEREPAGPLREAAESSLVACFSKQPALFTPGAQARIIKTIPWQSGLRAVGSSLRVLSLVKDLAPYRAELQKQRDALAPIAENSRRPEDQVVLSQFDSLLLGTTTDLKSR